MDDDDDDASVVVWRLLCAGVARGRTLERVASIALSRNSVPLITERQVARARSRVHNGFHCAPGEQTVDSLWR